MSMFVLGHVWEKISFFHFEFSSSISFPSIGGSQRICIKTAPAAWWVCWLGRREGNRVAGSLAVLFLSGRLELLFALLQLHESLRKVSLVHER